MDATSVTFRPQSYSSCIETTGYYRVSAVEPSDTVMPNVLCTKAGTYCDIDGRRAAAAENENRKISYARSTVCRYPTFMNQYWSLPTDGQNEHRTRSVPTGRLRYVRRDLKITDLLTFQL